MPPSVRTPSTSSTTRRIGGAAGCPARTRSTAATSGGRSTAPVVTSTGTAAMWRPRVSARSCSSRSVRSSAAGGAATKRRRASVPVGVDADVAPDGVGTGGDDRAGEVPGPARFVPRHRHHVVRLGVGPGAADDGGGDVDVGVGLEHLHQPVEDAPRQEGLVPLDVDHHVAPQPRGRGPDPVAARREGGVGHGRGAARGPHDGRDPLVVGGHQDPTRRRGRRPRCSGRGRSWVPRRCRPGACPGTGCWRTGPG